MNASEVTPRVCFNDLIGESEVWVGADMKSWTKRAATGGKGDRPERRRPRDIEGKQGARRRRVILVDDGAAYRRAKKLLADLLSRGIDDECCDECDLEAPPGEARPALVSCQREWLIDSVSCVDIVGQSDLGHCERAARGLPTAISFWSLLTGPQLRARR